MTIKWALIASSIAIIVSAKLQAGTTIPIQRIDVANLLTTGAVNSPVILAFDNGGSNPCVTMLMAFQDTATIWAGTGQTCLTPISSVTITPFNASSGVGVIYQTPANPVVIDNNIYSTRLIISQNTAPVFDAINGAMITPGTIQIGKLSQLKKLEV